MERNQGKVESYRRLEPYPDPSGEPWYRSGRARLFSVTFMATLVLGLLYTLLQPVVYRSSATVLMTAPRAIDAPVSEADIQNVAIQRAILLGTSITGRLENALQDEFGVQPLFQELGDALLVEAVPETNLVEMAAQGEQAEFLPSLVSTWIDVYLEVRAEDIARSKSGTEMAVLEEIDGLAIKLEETRDNLEQYRIENEILSVERQENEVMARLDGLNKSLNAAIEEEVKARAHLDTLREAIRGGQNLVPPEQRSDVTALENELQTLRADFAEARKRYTMEYINKQPGLRTIAAQIEQLELELEAIYRAGRESELGSAAQAYAAAQQTVAQLQLKLNEHKDAVARFNRIYATHQSLADDLARLEELKREAQARLVQVQVSQVEKYPQVSVIQRPRAEAQRIGPNYMVLLGLTVLASVCMGVFAVWLQGFLSPRPAHASAVTLSGVHLYPQEVDGKLAYTSVAPQQLSETTRPRLGSEGQRNEDEDDAPTPDEKG